MICRFCGEEFPDKVGGVYLNVGHMTRWLCDKCFGILVDKCITYYKEVLR